MYDQILVYVANHIKLHPQEVQIFVQMLRQQSFKKGDIILHAGEVCENQYFITNGCVKTSFLSSQGEEHIVQFGIENWWAGDVRSFVKQEPADYCIEALEDTETFTLSFTDVNLLFEDVPKFERLFRIITQNAYAAAQARIVGTISKTAEDRYTDFLAKYPGLDQRVPQYMIASYIGVTPEFFSKMKKEFYKKK